MVALWSAVCYSSACLGRRVRLYPTVADRVSAAEAINASPAVVALYGPIVDVHSLGELAMTKMTVLYAVFVALLLLVLVRRHTRTRGGGRPGRAPRRDRDRAATRPCWPPSRAAPSSPSLLGLLAALVDIAGGLPLVGSLAFGASWTGIGLVAAGADRRGVPALRELAHLCGDRGGALGVLFLLRAVGDTSAVLAQLALPVRLGDAAARLADPRWWVLLLYVACVALVALAQVLRGRRDLGSGLLAARPGPETGSPRLADAVALSIRLHGPMLLGWTVALAVLGWCSASIAPNIGSMLDSPAARDMMTASVGGRPGGHAGRRRAVDDRGGGHLLRDRRRGPWRRRRARRAHRAGAGHGHLALDDVRGHARGGAGRGELAAARSRGGGRPGAVRRRRSGDTLGQLVPAALAQAPAVWLVTAIAVAAYSLEEPVGGARLGLPGDLPDPGPARRAAPLPRG